MVRIRLTFHISLDGTAREDTILPYIGMTIIVPRFRATYCYMTGFLSQADQRILNLHFP